MKERELSYRWGHVWLGKIPSRFHCQATDFLGCVIEPRATVITEARCVGIRLFLAGSHGSVGILGAEFMPTNDGKLELKVALSDRAEFCVPPAYSQAIVDEAKVILADDSLLGAGRLSFIYAAHHPVDSSENIFRRLTRSIILLTSCFCFIE